MQNLDFYMPPLPGWLSALVLVAVGCLVASAGRIVFARLLRWLHFDPLCERTGVCDFLRKGEVPLSPSALAGRGLYWLILMATFLGAARLLDIAAAAEFRHRVVAAFPGFLSGALVLAVGLIVVAFLSGFVRTLTRNAGSQYANLWSRITRWAGAILVLAIALEQADIRSAILTCTIQVAIAALAFGTALAFGLGCKDLARNAMERLIADLKERHRDRSKPDMEG